MALQIGKPFNYHSIITYLTILLLNETGYDVKNYADRWDLHNSPHHAKTEFNNICFIIHSKYF